MKAYLSIFLTLLPLHLAFALSTKPEVCPSISAIKAIGLHEIEQFGETEDPDSVYAAYSVDRYQTNNTWFFNIAIPLQQAISNEDALNKARELLLTLAGTPIPQEKNDEVICLYQVKGDYPAFAQVLYMDDDEDELILASQP